MLARKGILLWHQISKWWLLSCTTVSHWEIFILRILRPSQKSLSGSLNGSPVAHSQSTAGHVLQNANATPRRDRVVSNHVRVFTRSISKPPWWVLGMSAVPWQKERYLMNSADWSEINLRRAKNACPLVCFLVVKGKHLTPFSFSTCKPIPAITVAPRFPTQPRCKDTTGARVLTSTEKETHNRLFRCPTEINLSGIPTKQMSERNYEPHPDWCFPSLENMHVVDALDNSSSNNHIN